MKLEQKLWKPKIKMNAINFPISAQVLIPSEDSVSLRIMFNKSENISNSITLRPTQTLTINSVSVTIEQVDSTDLGNWAKFKICASTGELGVLALDLNFMGNEFRIQDTEGVHWHGDEVCFDLPGNSKKELVFWIMNKPSA
ncbi:hypothetical protein P3602_24785 [Vibrio parahaemolyticus]|nr:MULTISPECIES: hypothetical protein [Vibrio]MDW1568240.1 hypothetical protein [Vibrio sp. YT-15]MDF5109130.1 hypothetical protein [Vibrio parahaemolyticus]MDF5144035.1 hypothetical protein [Vibrio parahaemolyticus]MDF5154462.1 hypothetical protein [Vibrio parahaemolyticus]MDF5646581.1 hypothetical protein [Vibrio parahaemolyticus]